MLKIPSGGVGVGRVAAVLLLASRGMCPSFVLHIYLSRWACAKKFHTKVSVLSLTKFHTKVSTLKFHTKVLLCTCIIGSTAFAGPGAGVVMV